ncbi:MAG: alpha/beta hydrolase [Bacteroidota bacterium]
MQLPQWLIISGRIALALGAFTLLSGIVYEQTARYLVRSADRPQGTFVEINGHPLHLVKEGEGGPTVVFVPGIGEHHASWKELQSKVAATTTTLNYDRFGLLFSKVNRDPLEADAISKDLEALLEQGDFPRPYILVGQGLASCFLRPFIRSQEDNIASIILLDPEHHEYEKRMSSRLRDYIEKSREPRWWTEFQNGFGFLRSRYKRSPHYDFLHAEDPNNVFYRDNFFRSVPGIFYERKAQESFRELANTYATFGDIPLTIMSGTGTHRTAFIQDQQLQEEAYQLWQDLQKEQLMLSDDSRQVLVAESGAAIHIEQPDAVVRAIKEHLQALEQTDTQSFVVPETN